MKKIILGITIAVALTGCNSSKKVVYMQDVPLDTPIEVQAPQLVKVRPGDMLSINVTCKEPQLAAMFNPTTLNSQNQTGGTTIGSGSGSFIGGNTNRSGNGQVLPYTVSSTGDIDFPVLGDLHVAGMTREQIAKMIKERIKAGNYIEDPKVNVSFMNLHYTVLGEVGRAGTYNITDDKVTLLDALAQAGDLTILGKRDCVYVTRTEEGKRTTYKVDLTGSDFYNSPIYYIQQDDVIYVEPNGIRAGQSTVNENSFKSVSMWMSIASFLMSLSVFIFK